MRYTKEVAFKFLTKSSTRFADRARTLLGEIHAWDRNPYKRKRILDRGVLYDITIHKGAPLVIITDSPEEYKPPAEGDLFLGCIMTPAFGEGLFPLPGPDSTVSYEKTLDDYMVFDHVEGKFIDLAEYTENSVFPSYPATGTLAPDSFIRANKVLQIEGTYFFLRGFHFGLCNFVQPPFGIPLINMSYESDISEYYPNVLSKSLGNAATLSYNDCNLTNRFLPLEVKRISCFHSLGLIYNERAYRNFRLSVTSSNIFRDLVIYSKDTGEVTSHQIGCYEGFIHEGHLILLGTQYNAFYVFKIAPSGQIVEQTYLQEITESTNGFPSMTSDFYIYCLMPDSEGNFQFHRWYINPDTLALSSNGMVQATYNNGSSTYVRDTDCTVWYNNETKTGNESISSIYSVYDPFTETITFKNFSYSYSRDYALLASGLPQPAFFGTSTLTDTVSVGVSMQDVLSMSYSENTNGFDQYENNQFPEATRVSSGESTADFVAYNSGGYIVDVGRAFNASSSEAWSQYQNTIFAYYTKTVSGELGIQYTKPNVIKSIPFSKSTDDIIYDWFSDNYHIGKIEIALGVCYDSNIVSTESYPNSSSSVSNQGAKGGDDVSLPSTQLTASVNYCFAPDVQIYARPAISQLEKDYTYNSYLEIRDSNGDLLASLNDVPAPYNTRNYFPSNTQVFFFSRNTTLKYK